MRDLANFQFNLDFAVRKPHSNRKKVKTEMNERMKYMGPLQSEQLQQSFVEQVQRANESELLMANLMLWFLLNTLDTNEKKNGKREKEGGERLKRDHSVEHRFYVGSIQKKRDDEQGKHTRTALDYAFN